MKSGFFRNPGRAMPVLLLTFVVGSAHAAVHDYIVSAQGGDITGAQLSAMLQKGNVTLQSSQGKKHGAGNVIINDTVTWTGNNTLTLIGSNNVSFKSAVTGQGNTAGLVVSPNTPNGTEPASGSGKYDFGKNAVISLTGTTPSLTINGVSYVVINSLGTAKDVTTPPAAPTLQSIAAAANLGGNYALGSNIDASATSGWNKGAGFTPISGGKYNTQFTGRFDGLGHTISNLTIKTATDHPITNNSYVGLFGQVGASMKSATVRNVNLVNASITANIYVGGIAGLNYGLISNVTVGGSVTGGRYDIGGVVGQNLGNVQNSSVTANVATVFGNSGQAGFDVGGIVGENYGSVSYSYATGTVSGGNDMGGITGRCHTYCSITNSYATGNVSGYTDVGGVVGHLGPSYAGDGGSSTLTNSYALGAVTGTTNVGGLVGMVTSSNPQGVTTIANSYSAGAVTLGGGGSGGVGGLIGNNVPQGGTVAITNSYWDTVASGQTTSAGGTGMITSDMMTCSEMQGYVFVGAYATGNTWVIVDTDGTLNNADGAAGATYPKLAAFYFRKPWNQSTFEASENGPAIDARTLAALLAQGEKDKASGKEALKK